MYDPRSQESDDQQTEWVEIWNFGRDSVHLKGFQITSGSKARPHAARQRLILGDMTMPAGAYLVIGIGNRKAYQGLGLPEFGVYAGETRYAWLTNDGDGVAIRDADGKIIDDVVYEARSPWPVVRGSGSSIQLAVPPGADPRQANDEVENWVASDSTNSDLFEGHGRGTPGAGIKGATTRPSVAVNSAEPGKQSGVIPHQ
jgi:hypothetical protein